MPTTKITVVSTSVIKSGETWTLREVVATDAQGLPIDKTLKTFEANLPVGQLIDVEVEKNTNPKYDEYMIRLPGSKGGGGGGGGGSQLSGRVDLLEEQVQSINTRLGALQARVDAKAMVDTPPPAQPASAVAGPADDDIPF